MAVDIYPLSRCILLPAVKVAWPALVEGLGNVPGRGPAIIAPNHISVLDSVFLVPILPRRIAFIGKAEYLDSWKTRYFFQGMGSIAVDRSGAGAGDAALDTAAKVLEGGNLFGIFPEGTRTRDGYLHRGKTGAARLSVRTGAPVIPVGIRGTDLIQPPGARAPRPGRRWEIRFGEPIYPDRYGDPEKDPTALRTMTDEIMFEIAELSGQRYVDSYERQPDVAPPAPMLGRTKRL